MIATARSRGWKVTAFVLLAWAGAAAAQDTADAGAGANTISLDSPMAGVTMPKMIAGPTADDIYAAWPAQARELGMEGMTRFSCTVTLSGDLQDCQVKTEEYKSLGLGAAALTLVPKYRFTPGAIAGRPAPIAIDFIIQFTCGSRCAPLNLADVHFPLVVTVPWGEAPTPADVVQAYPPKAAQSHTGGRVVLECEFRADGRLRSCDKSSETPTGEGFGAAAMALAPKFRAAFPPGSPIDGSTVFVPFIFDAGAGRVPGITTGTPDWTSLPPNTAFLQVYPKLAVDQRVTHGQATLDCALLATGKLGDCSVASETPAGLGFGQAALSLSDQFAMSLWSASGLPTIGARIKAPVSFQLQERAVAQHITKVERPEWAQQPSQDQLMQSFPPRAQRLSRSGHVVLDCHVQIDGKVDGCTVVSEDPTGFQFGAAAISLSRTFRMKPLMVDGEPVMPEGASVRIPINFVAAG